MKITVVLLAVLIVASLSSCKDKKNDLTEQKVEVIEVVKPKPVAPPVEKPVVKKENYYLVAGCFDIKSNAEELNSKLLNAGYNSKIIPFYNMNMVTYDGFETRQEAQDALNQIVLDPEKELAWVFPMK